jgi:hypothetical protein
MDTNKIVLISVTSTPTTTATATKTTVVYKNPVNVVTPHYNPYKSQYYN